MKWISWIVKWSGIWSRRPVRLGLGLGLELGLGLGRRRIQIQLARVQAGARVRIPRVKGVSSSDFSDLSDF